MARAVTTVQPVRGHLLSRLYRNCKRAALFHRIFGDGSDCGKFVYGNGGGTYFNIDAGQGEYNANQDCCPIPTDRDQASPQNQCLLFLDLDQL